MNKHEILDTVTFIVNCETIELDMRISLIESDLDLSILKNTTIIVSEYNKDGSGLQEMKGFDMAYELLQINPKEKIFLFGFLPFEYALKHHEKATLVLTHENVRFLQAPFEHKEIVIAMNNISMISISSNDYNAALSRIASKAMGSILHSLNAVKDMYHPKEGNESSRVDSAISEARDTFPSLRTKSNHEVLDFIKASASDRPLVKKGKMLDGLFCDIEGTLLCDGMLNIDLLNYLKMKDQRGIVVTLWSDGDLDGLQAILNSHDINFPLVAKRDFAGAEVLEAIDDLDEVGFTALTKINCSQFTNVKDMVYSQ